MSEDEQSGAGREEIWLEKYRPRHLDGIVGQETIVERLESYVRRNDLPHMLFAGPAGIGKCTTGETPVLTDEGLTRIEDVVGDVEGFANATDGTEVLTFTERGEFEFVEPSHVFGKETDELVEVRTRDGADLTVTPEHPLLVLTHDGLTWRDAGDLQSDDRIVRPLEAPLPETDTTLDWLPAMDGDRTYVHVSEGFARQHAIPIEENLVGIKKAVVRCLREGKAEDEIVEAVPTTRKTVQSVRREFEDENLDEPATVCSLSYLRDLDVTRDELREQVRRIQYVSPTNNRRSEPIAPPWKLTPALAEFVGLAVTESQVDGGRIKFYNTDQTLRDRFEHLVRELFGVEPRTGEQQGVPYVEIGNRTITHYLESCFDTFDSAMGGDGIGSALLRADEPSRAAFLRAVFDAEGYVTQSGTIELTQKDEHRITLLAYLLAGFGIPARRARERKRATNGSKTERTYHTLYISGAPDVERFQDEIGFSIERKARRLADAASRSSNPNDDTIPVQEAVTDLCQRMNIEKTAWIPDTLNPESPGRRRYLGEVSELIDAATERLEAVQEARERLTRLEPALADVVTVPAQWIETRRALEPLVTRKSIAARSDVRTDRLLEYARGDRTPYANRARSLLSEVDDAQCDPPIETVQSELRYVIETLDVPYEQIAADTEMRGGEVSNLLENDDHEIRSLTRFATVADRLDAILSQMASTETLELLRTLHRLVEADVYLDEVEKVTHVDEKRRVYDLTVPKTRNYVAGAVPTVMHNTTCAIAVARELYGEEWEEHFLELNASDERGIDVVRDRIKSFARTSFGGVEHRIIFLDEADALCLPPETKVVAGYPSSPEIKQIKDVAEDGEPMPSVDFETNAIQSDKGKLVDSGVADFFELELEDGRTVLASLTHPFFVVGDDGKLVEKELQELTPGDEIADFKDDVGVSKCEICGDWTPGRFCSTGCKNEGHSRDMEGEGNPMYGTEWSDERREKIVETLSDGRLGGEDNPNYGGEFAGTPVWEMDEETISQFRETISEMRSGTTWEEWVVDADAEKVKERIGRACSEWWNSLDDDAKERLVEKSTENCDYPVCDISGDNNPMRDPEIAKKVSESLKGHEPTGGNIRYSDELGHLVRSDWEYEVAKSLQSAGIEYEYEPEFELSDSVFHPDFLIDDTVVEVKGVAKLWGQTEKVEEFLETYGDDYRFVVVGDGELPHHEHYERDEFEPGIVADGGPRTVQTVEVRNIEYSHRGKAYNISMEQTPNFMLANGILTHNTSDAQSALRRTMEQFSNNVRFILSCNYSSQIIDPIQSRCAVFRFSPLGDEAVEEQIREIATEEGIELTDDGVDALVYAADGDMRKAINGLQAAAVTGDVVDEEGVFEITSTARPEDIREMVTRALDGDFTAARSRLDELVTEEGIAGGDIIDQLHRSVWEFDLDDEAAVRLLDRIGEADYRITAGANERIQLEALLASLALEE
ncbi:MAG: replication factor C small subunit [Haloarculaceae archaeon]|jgi:replication factor C small subunit